jgi:hypothetical protein
MIRFVKKFLLMGFCLSGCSAIDNFDYRTPGDGPAVQITNPVNDDTRHVGKAIEFVGVASDPIDGMLGGAALLWIDSVDGELSTGASINHTYGLGEVGDHTVSLVATDSRNLSRSAAILLHITL